MNKFKALLIKDLQINKKILMMPVWILLGYYLLVLLGLGVAYVRSDFHFSLSDIHMPDMSTLYIVSYLAGIGIMSFPGIMAGIFTLILTQSALNEDIRRNSELFHRSQPVSLWLRTLSKYVSGIAGNWLTYLGLGLFNLIIVTIVLALVHQLRFDFLMAGWLQAFVATMKITLIVGSICFFFSSIFKDKAFLQGLAILVGIQFLIWIFNTMFGWNLPLPLNYLYDLIGTNSIKGFDSYVTETEVVRFINRNWQDLVLSWRNLIQILFSGALFICSTIIYKNKEIK